MNLSSKNLNTYKLLDCGSGKRLELIGTDKVIRPAPHAIWEINNSALWEKADAVFSKDKNHKGKWQKHTNTPKTSTLFFNDIKAEIRLTDTGQLGIFPEQLENWLWLKSIIEKAERPLKILNGFAYTGLATIFSSSSGKNTEVTHVDSSKATVNWARKNAELNNIQENPIRWITEDIVKFIKREQKRNNKYDAIILDPPAFGRGLGNENWKLSRDLDSLINSLNAIISDNPLFVLLRCHDPKLNSNNLADKIKTLNFPTKAKIEHDKLIIPGNPGNDLPNGIFARIMNL